LEAIDPKLPDEGDVHHTLFGVAEEIGDPAADRLLRHAQSLGGLRTLTLVLLTLSTGLYLLERLEPVLRPLLIAILLCYLFLPVYTRLRRYMRPVFTFLIIAVGITLGLQGLARMVYRDVDHVVRNLPRYQEREAELERYARELLKPFLPKVERPKGRAPAPAASDSTAAVDNREEPAQTKNTEPVPVTGDALTTELAQRIIRGAASAFLSVFLETIVVAFYMIFLLQSASRLPDRIRASFTKERAHSILDVTGSINRAISEYLVVKVKASLLVGIPVGLACWAFGITGAVTWGVITFFGNFLPYIGALVAIVPPVVLAFLEFNPLWPPILFTLVLLAIHGITANLIEPAMTGKALGLSPLIVLIGLAFWSLLWGFVGMVLAVPLTVIFKIVLEHTPATLPLARMISDHET
jgi:predicted PurR-regulated permease PerM